MPTKMRLLKLTVDHISRVHKVVDDQGLMRGAELHTHADYDTWVQQMIHTHPAQLHRPASSLTLH